jgi:hypothetical protein
VNKNFKVELPYRSEYIIGLCCDDNQLSPTIYKWINENIKQGWSWDVVGSQNSSDLNRLLVFYFEDMNDTILFKLSWL